MASFLQQELDALPERLHDYAETDIVVAYKSGTQVSIRFTATREATAMFQFPPEYPHDALWPEIKSKSLPIPLLKKLQAAMEAQADASATEGEPAVVPCVLAIHQALSNKLCGAFDEVLALKKTDFKGSSTKIVVQPSKGRVVAEMRRGKCVRRGMRAK